jgi:hypothetical protein
MIMRGPYSRTATRRAHRFKIRKEPRRQPGRLNGKLKSRLGDFCGHADIQRLEPSEPDRYGSGAPAYPDELGVRYVWDTTVPNGRHISPGDLAVIRDNRMVFGAGWIDSIQTTPGRKITYRCPNCTSTDFKHRTRRQRSYRCASCTTEFDVPAEEEFTVQVFTANYSRTWRLADRPFPEGALDTAYISRSQQNAIRRLDVAQLRPVLDAHLITGAPGGVRTPGRMSESPAATGWDPARPGLASSDSGKPCSAASANPAPSPVRGHPERSKSRTSTSTAQHPSTTREADCSCDATCMLWSIGSCQCPPPDAEPVVTCC